jgi:hypothetical protein
MASSTFSFEGASGACVDRQRQSRGYLRYAIALLAVVLLLLGGLEAAMRIGYRHISRMEARTYAEYQAALLTRPGGPSRPTILLLGNSLLLQGVDYDALRNSMQPAATPVRFGIESTTYLDWYYGLKRLLREGAHPDFIVLCVSISQLLSDRISGEYPAHYLIQLQDLASAGKESGLDLTSTSGLLFAHYSLFYAGRNNLRNFAIYALDPSYAEVLHNLMIVPGRPHLSQADLVTAAQRLNRLKQLCRDYKVGFVFLLPPGFEESGQSLVEAGERAGIRMLMPVPESSWSEDHFKDGVHLNPAGALQFTKVLSSALLRLH